VDLIAVRRCPCSLSPLPAEELYDPVRPWPPMSGRPRCPRFAKRLNASLAIIDKRRTTANVAEVVNCRR